MSKYPAVQIEGCAVHENTFSQDGKVWNVTNLIARAKDLEPFDLPLAAIYLGTEVWGATGTPYGMAFHMRRALDVDTSYPVIMSEEGFIMDGWHRVLRALIDGNATIKAVRFAKTPPHDYLEPKT
ncbi:hypothetical protein GJ699_02575 [Duganella sp. FT80W]|uniref:ParB/Sulfiredoxin domain-containing protein n=1 Tax=Duganella guangzhouensis TaxID=2666084 RepID=A0A6I2KSZ9_9BURK|nr:hypothetical protein [Duganella guangzhouensis]MRW88863.1 hypothetical protein [Duganella guangzhouensis]